MTGGQDDESEAEIVSGRASGTWGPMPMTVRALTRSYFSTYLLWGARNASDRAETIEDNLVDSAPVFDIEHRTQAITAVVLSGMFLEAMVNELFQDAADGHGLVGDGYLSPLSERTVEMMAEWWDATNEGFDNTLAKYQFLLFFADAPRLDKGANPYQDAALTVSVRNALVHYKPEYIARDIDHRLTKMLAGRVDPNRLTGQKDQGRWHHGLLGAGLARWAYTSAKALTDEVCRRVGIMPNYQRMADQWAK